MYDEEQKKRYIEDREFDYLTIRSFMSSIFKMTEKYEERSNKDCCNFTIQEIANMYSSLMTHSWNWLININSQLSVYTSWCLNQNLVKDNQNHYAELSRNDLKQYLNVALRDSMVISRRELMKVLQEIPNVSDQFLVFAIFEGFGGLKFADFYEMNMHNFDGNYLVTADRKLEVPEKLKELAQESTDTYIKYTEDGMPKKTGYKLDDQNIIKSAPNLRTQPSINTHQRKIQTRLAMLENEFGQAFGFQALRNSGRIDMLKTYMNKDHSSDIRATYEKYQKDIEYRYGKLGTRLALWCEENEKYILNPAD